MDETQKSRFVIIRNSIPARLADQAGVETIEIIAVAALLLLFLCALSTVFRLDIIREIFGGILQWVKALGPDPISALTTPNSAVKLVALGVFVLIGLAIISSLIGTPWERDIPRKKHASQKVLTATPDGTDAAGSAVPTSETQKPE